jgi:hypothetical protein
MTRQVRQRPPAEAVDLGEQLVRLVDLGEARPRRAHVGVIPHAVQDVLVVEEREGLGVEHEVVAARRAELPLLEEFGQAFGHRGEVGVVAPERLRAAAHAALRPQGARDRRAGRARRRRAGLIRSTLAAPWTWGGAA